MNIQWYRRGIEATHYIQTPWLHIWRKTAGCVGIRLGGLRIYFSRQSLKPLSALEQRRKAARKDGGAYRAARTVALDRAGHRCQMCGCALDRSNASVHHIKPRVDYPELAADPDNLTALCCDCHRELHRRMDLNTYLRQLLTTLNPCI